MQTLIYKKHIILQYLQNNWIMKMQRVEGFFQSFDMFAAPATLRAKGSSSITRTSAGVISFVFLSYFAYIFIFGMYKIFSFESISSSQTFEKLSLTKLAAYNFMFGIGNFRIDPQLFATNFDIKTIIRSNKDGIIENVTMQKCYPDQWKSLGEDYVEQFHLHYLDRFLCPTQPQKLRLINSSLVQNATYFEILIQPVNSSDANYRNLLKKISNDETNKFNLFYLDSAVIPNEEDPVQYFINVNNFAFISSFKAHKSLIRLSNFEVNTDFSIFPIITNVETVNGYNIADTVLTSIDTDLENQRSTITFQLNNDLYRYSRKVGKIDQMFSYAGGLFALVIWCLAFFVSSFNQHRYELMVAESTFNFDQDGHKIRQVKFTFWKYIKYSTYTWLQTYFCYTPNWDDCKKIKSTIVEANHQMDVTRLFRKLQFLQMALIHTQNENENLIIALTEPRSLAQVKQQRLILEYYFKIIRGEPAATVQDAINGHAEAFSNLEGSQILRSQQVLQKKAKSINDASNIDPMLQDPEQIKSKLIQYLDLRQNQRICEAIASYPRALQQAKQIKLSFELELTEEQLTKSFLKLKPEAKKRLMKKIPLKIIHRLCMRSQMLETNKLKDFKEVQFVKSSSA